MTSSRPGLTDPPGPVDKIVFEDSTQVVGEYKPWVYKSSVLGGDSNPYSSDALPDFPGSHTSGMNVRSSNDSLYFMNHCPPVDGGNQERPIKGQSP